MRELAAMPFDGLVELIDHPVERDIEDSSGRKYRSKAYAFWDMEPEESDLYARVHVRGRGLRRYQRYTGTETRYPGDPDADDREVGEVFPSWHETFAWVGCGILALILIVPWFLGIAYLISRIF
jgi:hypothetical protein